jgi:hypothetical protein
MPFPARSWPRGFCSSRWRLDNAVRPDRESSRSARDQVRNLVSGIGVTSRAEFCWGLLSGRSPMIGRCRSSYGFEAHSTSSPYQRRAMTSVLMVPVHLDLLHCRTDRTVVRSTADVTRLPYVGDAGGRNGDVAQLSDEIVGRPFQEKPPCCGPVSACTVGRVRSGWRRLVRRFGLRLPAHHRGRQRGHEGPLPLTLASLRRLDHRQRRYRH